MFKLMNTYNRKNICEKNGCNICIASMIGMPNLWEECDKCHATDLQSSKYKFIPKVLKHIADKYPKERI